MMSLRRIAMHDPTDQYVPATTLQALVDGHREFLGFLERRLGDRNAAEDLLQEAYVRSLERGGELRADESARAWFYRLLRNALIDRHRRNSVAGRHLEALAADLGDEATASRELDRVICACVARLVDTLKPEQAQALRRIELDGVAVKDFAREVGVSESNAGVRVFRARQALRQQLSKSCGTCAEHGCFDCCCRTEPPAAPRS